MGPCRPGAASCTLRSSVSPGATESSPVVVSNRGAQVPASRLVVCCSFLVSHVKADMTHEIFSRYDLGAFL